MSFRTLQRVFSRLRRPFTRPLLVAGVLLSITTPVALADPIQYTLQGSFTGSLGSLTFTGQQATFTFTGDSSTVIAEPGGYSNVSGTSTFALFGGPTATFASATFGVESQYGAAAFMDEQLGFAAGEYNEDTPDDVLFHPGPAYTGAFVSYGSTSAATDLGDLSLTDAGDLTFQALAPAVAATPEPSSLILLANGFALLGLFFRRRARLAD